MHQSFSRTDRVSELILRGLSRIIQKGDVELNSLGFVTISAVKLSPDLRRAKVYFTVFDRDIKATAAKLNEASGYFRGELAQDLRLRRLPELYFVYDESIEHGQRLAKLIDEVNKDLNQAEDLASDQNVQDQDIEKPFSESSK